MTTMVKSTAQSFSAPSATLAETEFHRLKGFIYDECGIVITDVKKTMLETRLLKRVKSLGLHSYKEYCDYLFSPDGIEAELHHMINQVTTNKTDFFREPAHFDFLTTRILPNLKNRGRPVMIWSAGCSSGEEPYTLAMTMKEYERTHHGSSFFILATDISTKVLEKAERAVYEEERISPIPLAYQGKYLSRSKDRSPSLYRIRPELRSHVQFRRLNFMDDSFGFKEQMDVIFCRNVIIYFDKATQEKLLNKFCECLAPGGYVFMGHSETLLGMKVPLVPVAPTVYRRIS
jgi:chemotaxis protein methyltransferase CheR